MDNAMFEQLKTIKSVPLDGRTELTEADLSQLASHTAAPNQTGGNYSAPPDPFGGQAAPTQPPLNVGSLFPAEIAVDLADIIFPSLMVLALRYTQKREYSKKVFQATKQEKELIEPFLQAYLNSINFTVQNPFNALLIVCTCVYGSKLIDITGRAGEPVTINAFPKAEKPDRSVHRASTKSTGGRPSTDPNSRYMRKKRAMEKAAKEGYNNVEY